MQLLEEINKIQKAKKMLFCDTTLLVNKIWASFVFKEIPNNIIELYKPKDYQLHLLCNIDLPWENDPLREHPNHRNELLELYEDDLINEPGKLCKNKWIKIGSIAKCS
jgi:nicotinamide riboside kinase